MSDIDLLSPTPETSYKAVQDQFITILGVNEAVQIMKCLQDDCCNGLYHCPFCNEKVFKPSRATKTIDHINLSHFPHAVYYKDLVILKCFQNCRTSGHYHCPVCHKEILKRLNFKEHLIHHIKDNNEDEQLIQAPNSKQPKKIKFSVFDDVELCCSPCEDALGKHYHCPICKVRTYNDVSSTLTHVWRCAEIPSDKPRGRKRITLTTDHQLPHPKQAQTIKYHTSIVRSPADLYLSRCEKENCCERKFHCPLCTVEKFKPNYQNHLLEHFNVHWKNRVLIDDDR